MLTKKDIVLLNQNYGILKGETPFTGGAGMILATLTFGSLLELTKHATTSCLFVVMLNLWKNNEKKYCRFLRSFICNRASLVS